jgi:multicomponent Na+:H+ antiporter subunit B
MSLMVKTITRFAVVLMLVYGIYIVLRGDIGPGGGFAGGVIIALAFIQLLLAFGKDAFLKELNREKCLSLAGLAALVFLLLVLRGFLGSAGHLVPLCDIALSVLVGAGLLAIFLALVSLTEAGE